MKLKTTMSQAPVLIMLNFQQPFALETDVNDHDIGYLCKMVNQ
jgi:hypothetical protein